MLTLDKVYKFNIIYFQGKEKKEKYIFADSDEEKVAENDFKEREVYLFADELNHEELRDLIDEVGTLEVSADIEPRKDALIKKLKQIYQINDVWDKVFVNANIEYFTETASQTENEGRVIIMQPYLPLAQKIISPKRLIDGKIRPENMIRV